MPKNTSQAQAVAMTPKQMRSLNKAKDPKAKAAMRAQYEKQNNEHIKLKSTGVNWQQTPASSNIIAPRGYGYYDAFRHNPFAVVTHASIGRATPVPVTALTGLVNTRPSVIEKGFEAGGVLIIIQPTVGATQAMIYQCTLPTDGSDPDPAAAITTRPITSTQFESGDENNAGLPLNAIPTRCSVRIRNTSQDDALGGTVMILRMTTGIAIDSAFTTNADLVRIMQDIRCHNYSRTCDGVDFRKEDPSSQKHHFQVNSTIVDSSKATWFQTFDQTYTVEQLPWTQQIGWDQSSTAIINKFSETLQNPAFTPIAFLLEPFQAAIGSGLVPNTYQFEIKSQFLAHYRQGSVLANMAISSPADSKRLDAHTKAEESGPIMKRVYDVATGVAEHMNNNRDFYTAAAGAMARQFPGGRRMVPWQIPMAPFNQEL